MISVIGGSFVCIYDDIARDVGRTILHLFDFTLLPLIKGKYENQWNHSKTLLQLFIVSEFI